MDVEISYPEKEGWIGTRELLDCGGQGNFVNEQFSKENLIPRVPKSIPIALVLADGECSDRGPITQFNPVILKTGRNEEPIGLDIATVAHDIILGKPWLDKHDPTIRWTDSTLTFNSSYCQQHCSHYGQTIPLHTWSQTPIHNSSPVVNPSSTQQQPIDPCFIDSPQKASGGILKPSSNPKSNSKSKSSSKPKSSTEPNSNPESKPKIARTAPQVSIIGPAAFALAVKQPGAQLYLMSLSEVAEIAELASTNVQESADPDLSLIPPEYHEFAEVFVRKNLTSCPSTARTIIESR